MSKSRKKRKSRESSRSPKATPPPASSKPKLPAFKKTILYKAVGGGPLRPIVTFTIHKPSGEAIAPPFFGLADSGADSTMFPMDVMADLGIAKSDCDELNQLGAGGQSKYWDWNGGKLPADFYGRTVNLCVQFCDTPFILLGREDFFAAFKTTFDQRGLRFSIEAY